MLRLLGRATSGNVQKAIFALEELGLAYEREDYGRTFGNTATDAYAALNPTRKVPTLLDGDLAIWESHTILRHLATKAGSAALYPTEPGPRSHVERWLDWTLASLNPVYLAGFRDAKKPAAEQGATTASDLAAELSLFDGQLAGRPWIAGETFSLADIALGPIVRRCIAFPFAKPELPHATAWLGRLNERPAFATAIAAG
jgi:glutathione S-transferase